MALIDPRAEALNFFLRECGEFVALAIGGNPNPSAPLVATQMTLFAIARHAAGRLWAARKTVSRCRL